MEPPKKFQPERVTEIIQQELSQQLTGKKFCAIIMCRKVFSGWFRLILCYKIKGVPIFTILQILVTNTFTF